MSKKKTSNVGGFSSFCKKLNRNMPVILSFFIPLFVMLLVFIQRGIYPFGDRSFLRTDLYHQYAPFFKELLTKLQNGESLLYSWDIGGGSNFLALYCYYLSSPTNWLVVLCPKSFVIEFITYMIVLKISLSGFTMAYYLKKHTGRNDYALTMFSSFYALSGFMAAYSWNIMWLDCIVLFPILILGLERLVRKDKCMLYCITLAITILTNYYIAIMICIALVFYFIMQLVIIPGSTEKAMYDKERGVSFTRVQYVNYPKKILEFAVYSLIGGGLAAILLVPAYFALQLSASANSTFPKTFTSYFSILEMLARHLDNVDVHLGLEHWPNIFCGVAILIFIPLYVMNKKVRAKEKISYFLMILFLLASFSMNFLNFIWHGFHYPNSLPCRQSFIYVFLLLTMAFKGYLGLRDRSLAQITRSIWIAVAFVLVCETLYAPDDGWNFPVYYVSIIFIGVYGLLAYLRCKYKNGAAFLAIAGLLIVFTENFMNTTMTSVTTVSRTNYVEYDKDYDYLEQYAKSIDSSAFSRYEKLKLRTKNDGSWYQYPSMSVFSSTANASISDYYKVLGMEAATNAYSKTGSTLFIDMLFGVKYEFSNITYQDTALRKLINTSGSVKLYENTCVLPLGFMVPLEMETRWYTTGANPIDTQNSFISAATGLYNAFKYVDVPSNETSQTASYEVKEPGYYYAYLLNSSIDEATTNITSKDSSTTNQSVKHTSLKRRFVLDIGYANEGDTITITSETDDQNLYFRLYKLQEDVLLEACEKLNEHGLNITSMSDTRLEGTIDVEKQGIMYTSIAYERGWKVYVDGVETEPVSFKDACLAVELSEGHHTIRMEYVPEGFYSGILLSIASLIMLLVVTMIRMLLRGHEFKTPFIEDIYPEDLEAELLEEAKDDSSNEEVSHDTEVSSDNLEPADKEKADNAELSKKLSEAVASITGEVKEDTDEAETPEDFEVGSSENRK